VIRVAIIGTHGIPARYGGFETFAEEFSQLLVREGYNVIVQCEVSDGMPEYLNGVKLFYSPVKKSEHPLRYYYSGLKNSLRTSEIIIITGSIGAPFYFLNFFKRRVLITNTDGIEYKRSKWSILHRLFLRFTEMLAVRFSDIVIADSLSIMDFLSSKYRSSAGKLRLIEYGAVINQKYNAKHLEEYKLSVKGYYLVVCRLEPENNLIMIIEGYLKSHSALPLLIVGNVTPTAFVKNILGGYGSDKVIFAGGIYDKTVLSSLRYCCKAYIHGHSVGGTNPSLLEAMGNGNVIICHDNTFNREVTADSQFYFSDPDSCSEAIKKVEKLSEAEIDSFREKSCSRIRDYYNWDNIIGKYTRLIKSLKI